jgi:hypothetical protein
MYSLHCFVQLDKSSKHNQEKGVQLFEIVSATDHPIFAYQFGKW